MADDIPAYLAWLESQLTPAYTARTVIPGHDTSHVLRMIARAPLITHLPDLDQDELRAAIWLHNLDRAPDLNIMLADIADGARYYLKDSPFTYEAQQRIAEAVGKHDGRKPGSTLLTALQALDRLDRMNALGVLTAATTHGMDKPLYIPRNPFRYELGEGGHPFSVYDDLAGRIMEFPQMIPLEMRYLIDVRGMRDLVAYVRALAGHVCRAHGLRNGVEQDLIKALGRDLYQEYGLG